MSQEEFYAARAAAKAAAQAAAKREFYAAKSTREVATMATPFSATLLEFVSRTLRQTELRDQYIAARESSRLYSGPAGRQTC